MGRIINFKWKLNGDEVMNMEKVLGSVLYPVTPRQEFIQSLHERMLSYSYPEGEKVDKQAQKKIVMLLVSLMGVTIMLGVWIRMIVSLFKMIGANQGTGRKPRKRRITPAHSVA